MNILDYELTVGQRLVLDRYARFLGSLHPTFRNIPVVFEQRRKIGHQLAVLAGDSRLENARFNERYLQGLWGGAEEVRLLGSGYVEDLAVFTRESLEIARQTSRNEPIGLVDFRRFSLSRSPIWQLFPPTNVPDLIHELALRFYRLRAAIRQFKYTVVEVYDESFGLKLVFSRAMDHRSCQCHVTPTVVQELFRQPETAPVWDIDYSSSNASLRAAEYKFDVAALFSAFSSVSSRMGLFLEVLYQRADGVINKLLQAKSASRLGELNFKLASITEGGTECLAMISELEIWLRK
ncbi:MULTISPECIES: hypothetical protein [unclassified Pseudomonas]|uniref:Uncharacterized protein n=1 Tax=Pseudomonas sp. MYb327 TaxID=2745230 RepID=A0AAU8DXU3_9PSED